MSRARRKQGQVDTGESKPIGKRMPTVCPLCGVEAASEMQTHIVSHAPAETCPNCGEKHAGWKVDWDGVMYPRPDVSLFYCDPCGVYTPVEPQSREEVNEADLS